jgi:hypothetical protein
MATSLLTGHHGVGSACAHPVQTGASSNCSRDEQGGGPADKGINASDLHASNAAKVWQHGDVLSTCQLHCHHTVCSERVVLSPVCATAKKWSPSTSREAV